MDQAPLRSSSLLADIAGLAVLAMLYGLSLATVYPGRTIVAQDPMRFVAIYLPFALVALFVWHQKRAIHKEPKWPTFAVSSIVLGALFFIGDLAIGHYLDPELPVLTAAMQLRGPWGFETTLLICPGVTFLALSGWARSLLLRIIKRE